MFHVKTSQNNGLFAILFYGHNHAFIVGHGVIGALGWVLGHGNGREQLLNLGLDGVYVDVAHHHNGLQVGAIPLVVIVFEVLIGKVVNDVHRAYGHAVFVFRALKNGGLQLFVHALRGHFRPARAPFFVYHAAFFVYLLILQQQVVAPIVEDEQHRVDHGRAFQRHLRDVVHRFVDAGVGIEVGSELHADGFAPRNDARRGAIVAEMLGSVEGHVL